ncbi:signal peptide containing protein [Theileria equi strain WA]|uniref:Signal peptide containing protein n=1 Tax=Theileria equi strain WA TaxID=1537102 RepID=L1LBI9_THEEQ|nr:signal peptide containing protein [Theileria equi strain WA]EKX72640.1 signal peptide containing protein [Theileria equi strain WA]|eukprot:XP_004832092.1 signal peptide containing protein [Theileria equi strain WA]
MQVFGIFLLFSALASGFRLQAGNQQTHNTPLVSCNRKRSDSLSLFKSSNKNVSRCTFFSGMCSRITDVAKKVNNTVPGGVLTAVAVPIATAAIIRYCFGGTDSNANKQSTSLLTRYQCSGCGFIIFPAKNREDKFFSASFTCPNCGAPKTKFVEKYKN